VSGRLLGTRLLAVLLLLALTACGGGGGGGGGGPTAPPPPPQPAIVFTGQGTSSPNSVSLGSGAGSSATTLFLEVRATSVTDLYGVAFDLRYPNTVLQFVRATPGPLIEGGSAQAAVVGTGNLVVGATRLGDVPGITGSGVLMTLEFTALVAGEGPFSFARNSALDPDARTLPGVTWSAGTVRVIR
jgi:hypothetical protein